MKKINKKGFTLIELLVVLVILSIIMVIAIPSVTSSIERNKAKQTEQITKLVESAAELYIDSHKNNSIINKTGPIYLKSIVCDGNLTLEEIKDPSNEKRTICGYVSYDKTNNDFKWQSSSCSGNYKIDISTKIADLCK